MGHHAQHDHLTTWAVWQRAQGLSTRTIDERHATISALLRYAETTPEQLAAWHIVQYCARDGLSASTRASYHATIRAFCLWLQRVGIRPDNVALSTPVPKRPKGLPRPVESDGLADMLRACNRRRTRAYILLAALAGLRVHEIAKMHGSNLDARAATLTVTGKGGKTSVIPVHRLLVLEASEWPADDWWFPSYTAGRQHIGPHAVSDAIRDVMRRANVPGTPHSLRHWFGTELVRSGVDLRVVQELMRHESPATTALYTRVDRGMQSAGLARLELPNAAA